MQELYKKKYFISNHFISDVRILLSDNITKDFKIIPKYIILHYDAASNHYSAVNWMLDSNSGVSAHLHISRSGLVTQLASFVSRCWHAGESKWNGLEDLNTYSIGIELQNDGIESFTEIQLDILEAICYELIKTYNILEILGHYEISPGRKIDPGLKFPMNRFKNILTNDI